MRPADFIRHKREGGIHGSKDLTAWVRGIVDGSVSSEQAAAWTMAVYFRGMAPREVVDLTACMRDSGRPRSIRAGAPRIDKHSTGGVGDKVSLCLAPLVAACGVRVPMVSGRGLGHTGGTLDKLSALDGFETGLDADRFEAVLERCSMVLAGASDDLAPADRLLYALRDACATVESIPLIVSSILSKKLAARLDGLVLDVKVGRGAFLPSLKEARALASELVRVSELLGCSSHAVLTDMDAPLGRAVGNAAELAEAVEVLQGRGPQDLWEVTRVLGTRMLELSGVDRSEAEARIDGARTQGRGLDVLREVVAAQGGDPTQLDRLKDWSDGLVHSPVRAERSGVITGIDARRVGEAVMGLGAGRRVRTDPIDVGPAVVLEVARGQLVQAGQVWAWVHHRPSQDPTRTVAHLATALEVGDAAPSLRSGPVLEELGALA